MRIGICDDEEYQINHIREMCLQYAKQKKFECEIIEFTDGSEVLKYHGEAIVLLFLDIEMKDMNGIEVMRRIESSDMIWRIVFVSSHEEQVWSTFGLKTLDFGRKPIAEKQVQHWINVALDEFQENVIIDFECENDMLQYSMQDIIYLEAQGNYVLVHCRDKSFLVSKNLKYWQAQLPKNNVIRIHKSYLVNWDYVQDIAGVYLILKMDHRKLRIGRTYRKEVESRYKNYFKERMRRRLCK